MSSDPIRDYEKSTDIPNRGEALIHSIISRFILFIIPTMIFDFIFFNLWQLMSPHLSDSWSKGFFYGCCMLILEAFMSICTIGMATVPMIPLLIISWIILVTI